ncbi:MAG: B12-binding domain-containing radical SAM protein [Cytophagaceae bacterium]
MDKSPEVLLVTPPFTQLNTPYPATMYLKGFLNTKTISSIQADLGIETIFKLFSSKGLKELFNTIAPSNLSPNSSRILNLKNDYINTIDGVIRFLQNKNPTLAYNICDSDFLPKASRFEQLADLEWAFGTLGINDKARHLATLYLEDLNDFIKEAIDPHFGFSRYAERLGRSATSFDELEEALSSPPGYIDRILLDLLDEKIKVNRLKAVCISIPFPGNLYGGLRCGQFIKAHYPDITVVMGGGYPNTELRSLSDPRVFKYIDFITLDDGERPVLCIYEYLKGERDIQNLKRTFALLNGEVTFLNGAKEMDIPFSQTGTPDYSGLLLDKYLSVIEIVNPMHRLWSDGRWNKLTMAHGCYWKKCSFCDISLDYIKNYEPVTASLLCDRMQEMIEATGETGFHFVDEAAPPALMRELALEIIRRNMSVTWWANIRFEQRFTSDLCRLLKASGCIAVSGGLEVASDRLLERMQKGVTVTQVAQVAANFTESGIMVHAYLMYGFPTQTAQETIDSLEMVRQLFFNNVIQSGFWHLFAMTAHSPVGLNPEAYGVIRIGPEEGAFANNDLIHEDPSGCDHEAFSSGLNKALFNYMHGICFDFPLQEWFDFKIPQTTIPHNYIENAINMGKETTIKDSSFVKWLGNTPETSVYEKHKKGKTYPLMKLSFENKSDAFTINTTPETGEWLKKVLVRTSMDSPEKLTIAELKADYENSASDKTMPFYKLPVWGELRKEGLLIL